MADSGTAVETTTNSIGSATQGPPATIDVTFSGQNVNYLVVGNGSGAAGVENRVVDGQFYLYIKGPDLQMHWYHDTSPNAAATMSFPDPRTLLQAVSPSAGLEDLGQENGRGHGAHSPAGDHSGLHREAADTRRRQYGDLIRRMGRQRQRGASDGPCRRRRGAPPSCVWLPPSASGPSSGSSPTVTIPPTDRSRHCQMGSRFLWAQCAALLKTLDAGTTLDVRFADLGDPETVAAPSGAVDQEGLG